MSAPPDRDSLLALLGWERPEWHKDASCVEHPELTWFTSVGEDQSRQRAICAGCLVRVECREAGANEAGIWGGESERARRRGLRTAA